MRNIYFGDHLTKLHCCQFQLIWSNLHDDICIKTKILSLNCLIERIIICIGRLNSSTCLSESPNLKHLSVISFKPEALQKYASLKPSPLQMSESVELLRALENGMVLGTILLDGDSISIDIREDYIRAKMLMMSDEFRKLY